MGNICFKKKKKSLLDRDNSKLSQITVETVGDCFICDMENVAGFEINSVLEKYKMFICNRCKNLK